MDTSHLIQYLSSYIFPTSSRNIVTNVVCGVSLGGHAAWQSLVHGPRINAAVSIIGCPDYMALMTDRARLTKLASYVQSDPPGASFVGSNDFPLTLVKAIEAFDPASCILNIVAPIDGRNFFNREPNNPEKDRLRPLMQQAFQDKVMLNMSGGDDKLVPYRCSKTFLRWLKRATGPSGYFPECNFNLKDLVFEHVGHAMSSDMAGVLDHFIIETLSKSNRPSGQKSSKI